MPNAKQEYQHNTCVQYLWERRKSVKQHGIKEPNTQESYSTLYRRRNNDGCQRNLYQLRLKKRAALPLASQEKFPSYSKFYSNYN